MRLSERSPKVNLRVLLEEFSPPPRFRAATFESYRPDPRYPSQELAKERLRRWVHDKPQGFFKRKRPDPSGIYLDGGFGVGKTHLLVSAFWEAPEPKGYLSFEELTYAVGLMGMAQAVERFSQLHYLFIDEFELDDPGNAQMVTHLLGQCMEKGLRVATTSNTPPGALGQGRFNAEQFKIQIQSLSRRFAVETLDGEDYRHRDPAHPPAPLDRQQLGALYQQETRPATYDAFVDLLGHLRSLHPIRYRYLFEGLEVVYLEGLAPISDQNDALRFVHFVDKLYDRGVGLRASGVGLERIFPESYRYGAFAKKYGRCLSRLAELLAEG
ncbi:cell division protein ZapE [Allomeiothermus silvanus]|uniref:AFG1-family ATPase n=1 Tax=Allomeiothermus silvanus (strain ATCC 700542 / DSM 9946 / NBRC 106475 / NCIMB 13440 / VI-R2) TaxID=526227 RepID=D7BGU0_ALLS1|nr:cell division protein ZapE [Allomeiothermus silvanus]ADH62094.1 AFG1-family ATPase [Allomeiothermus silvanus DSM 9946]